MTTFAVSTVALAAVAGTACGGSDDAPGTLSKGQFASKANAICAEAQPVRARLLQQLPAQPSGQADTGAFQLLAGSDRYLIRHVDALVPPDAAQDLVDRVLDGWRKRSELEEKYATAVGAMQAAQSLEGFTASLAQIDATIGPIATQLGMTHCTAGAS